jgi:hypothetical protein
MIWCPTSNGILLWAAVGQAKTVHGDEQFGQRKKPITKELRSHRISPFVEFECGPS